MVVLYNLVMEEKGEADIRALEQELIKLREYSLQEADSGFVWVYRGEGEKDERLRTTSGNAGKWFSTSFNHATLHVEKMKARGATETRVIAVAIPRSLIDRDVQVQRRGGKMPVGTDTVMVHFRHDLDEREVEGPVTEEPDAETYVKQFKFIKEIEKNSTNK